MIPLEHRTNRRNQAIDRLAKIIARDAMSLDTLNCDWQPLIAQYARGPESIGERVTGYVGDIDQTVTFSVTIHNDDIDSIDVLVAAIDDAADMLADSMLKHYDDNEHQHFEIEKSHGFTDGLNTSVRGIADHIDATFSVLITAELRAGRD